MKDMEKKKYVSPQMDIIPLERMMTICTVSVHDRSITGSRGASMEDMDLDFGGIDDEGELDPY